MKPMVPDAAYILNRRAYKESSLLLDVFSYSYGRQSILAQGALNSKKGWAGLLQVFQPLLMSWSGRSSLKTLVSLEAPSAAISLHNERLFSAYYLNELLLKLITVTVDTKLNASAAQTHQRVFVAYAEALAGLQDEANIEYPLRQFEYTLLADLGIFPDCSQDTAGQAIEPDGVYQIDLQHGFRSVYIGPGNDQSASGNAQSSAGKATKPFIKGAFIAYLPTLQDMASLPAEQQKEGLRQLKKLMRFLIDDALDGKEIMSRTLFHRYQPNRSIS